MTAEREAQVMEELGQPMRRHHATVQAEQDERRREQERQKIEACDRDVCSALLGGIKRREVKKRKRYMSMFVSLPFLSVAFSLFALLLFLFSAFLLYSVLRSASSLSSFLLLCPALILSFTLLCLFSFSSSDFCLCFVSCPPLFLSAVFLSWFCLLIFVL